MPQSCFDVFPGTQTVNILSGRGDPELTPHLGNLQILNWVKQIADLFNIICIDSVAFLNRPLRVRSKRQQLLGINTLGRSLCRESWPQGQKHTRS